jgi:hypothetical protein
MDLIGARKQLAEFLAKGQFVLQGKITGIRYQDDHAFLTLTDMEGEDEIMVPIDMYQKGSSRKGDTINVEGQWAPYNDGFIFLGHTMTHVETSDLHQKIIDTRKSNKLQYDSYIKENNMKPLLSRPRPENINNIAYIYCQEDEVGADVAKMLQQIGLNRLDNYVYPNNQDLSIYIQKILSMTKDTKPDVIYYYHSAAVNCAFPYPAKLEGYYLGLSVLKTIQQGVYVMTSLGDLRGAPLFCNYVHENRPADTIIRILKLQREAMAVKLQEFREIVQGYLYNQITRYRELLNKYDEIFQKIVHMYPAIDKAAKMQELVNIIDERFSEYRQKLEQYQKVDSMHQADQMVYLVNDDMIVTKPDMPFTHIFYPRCGRLEAVNKSLTDKVDNSDSEEITLQVDQFMADDSELSESDIVRTSGTKKNYKKLK